MSKKSLVAKDLAVVEVISHFCRRFNFRFFNRGGMDIRYADGKNPSLAMAIVKFLLVTKDSVSPIKCKVVVTLTELEGVWEALGIFQVNMKEVGVPQSKFSKLNSFSVRFDDDGEDTEHRYVFTQR